MRRILVLNPSPLFPRSVPNCLSLADRSGLDKAKACGVDANRELRQAAGTHVDRVIGMLNTAAATPARAPPSPPGA